MGNSWVTKGLAGNRWAAGNARIEALLPGKGALGPLGSHDAYGHT